MTLKDLKLGNIGLKFLFLFIIVCPIFTYAGKDFGIAGLRIGQEQCFQMGATVLFIIVFLENIYFALFLGWTVFLYTYWNFPENGGNYLMNIVWAGILYQVSYKLINRSNIKLIYKAFLILAWLNLLRIIIQITGNEFLYLDTSRGMMTQPVGMMGIKAHMGMLFAMTIPLVLRNGSFLGYATTFIFMYPIWLSRCSVAVVGALIAILWHFWYCSRRVFVILVVLFVLGGSWYVHEDSKDGMMIDRLYLWKTMSRDIAVHPLMGWGLDSFRNVGQAKPFMYGKITSVDFNRQKTARFMYHKESNTLVPPKDFKRKEGEAFDIWDNAHNEYMQLIYEFGIIPVFILLLMIKDMIKRFDKYNYDSICLVGFFITIAIFSIGQFPFHVARLGFAFPILLAAYYKLTDKEQCHGKKE